MPKVYNKYHGDAPKDAVYIGRGSKWGNPYTHLPSTIAIKVGSREEAIVRYKEYLGNRSDLIEAAKTELKGKDLVCFCKPKPCHGDILLQVANENPHTDGQKLGAEGENNK